MTASLTTADGTYTPVGDLAHYSISHNATPLDPRDSSSQIPTFSATLTNVLEDAKSLAGKSVQLEDWSGSISTGRVAAVNTGSTGLVGIDANTMFERLNTDQTTLPIIYSETAGVDPVAEALSHWMLMAGIPPQRITGNLLHYISGKSIGTSTYGYIADDISKWRWYGPPSNYDMFVPSADTYTHPIEVNPAQSVVIGTGFAKGTNVSESKITARIPGRDNAFVYYTLQRVDNTWTLFEEVVETPRTALVTKTWTPSASVFTSPSVPEPIIYAFVLVKANADSTKVDVTLRLMEVDNTGATNFNDTTVTGVISSLRERPRPVSVELGYDNTLTIGRSDFGRPRSYFMVESSTLQGVFPTANYSLNLGATASEEYKATMPFKIPGFTGNVWDNMRELCSLLELDLFFAKDQIIVQPRSVMRDTAMAEFREPYRASKGSVSEAISDRETAKSVEVLYREMKGDESKFSNALLWKANSVFTLEQGETKEEIINTDSSFVFLHQPVAVSGVPVPYTSSFSSYVITGNDGYIVDPNWWVDNGGYIKVYNTKESGEIRMVMQAPAVDTVRAPYRISEGAADRPALYILGYGLPLTEPITLTSFTGAESPSQDVGVTFDSPFITKRLLAQNTAMKLANLYGTASSTMSFEIRETDIIPPNADTLGMPMDTPIGDSVYWKGSYYRISGESLEPGVLTVGIADRFNTIRVVNGEFATGKTVADWNTLHAGKTLRETNIAPLPNYES